jgi:deazaflavin-dependent oxidoreductase (nitroreductase family)
MKIIFKLFMGLHVFLYRLSGGRFGNMIGGAKILILTTTGRKSGKPHTNPVSYFEREGGYLIVASNAGRSNHPAWYHNLKANPAVTIQIADKVMQAHAEIVQGEAARASAWKQVVETAPSFRGYEKSTAREIPLVLLKAA